MGLRVWWQCDAACSGAQQEGLEALARAHAWPPLTRIATTGVLLRQTPERLELHELNNPKQAAIYVDFAAGKAAHRRKFGGGRGQTLARALGLKAGKTPKILDATAGMGQDGFVLASLGAEVTMLERHPVVAALLNDGVRRAQQSVDPELATIALRLRVVNQDARTYLSAAQPSYFDAVYLDPMYPHSTKASLPKKEMRLFRDLVGADEDAAEVVLWAQAVAAERVVVKRPRAAPPLHDGPRMGEVQSKNTRFDLYAPLPGDKKSDAEAPR